MANEKDHFARAAHNERFLGTVSDEFADWLAIIAFYVAVHLVESFFARHERHSRGHRERNEYLKRRYRDIYREFYPLYNYSLFVRYDCGKADAKYVRKALIDKRLPAIRALLEERE